MTITEFHCEMLICALQAGKILAEVTYSENIQPEQKGKNVATIISLMLETESFLKEVSENLTNK